MGKKQIDKNYYHINELNKAYLKHQLVIFYGAGLSKPLGLPGWGELVDSVVDTYLNMQMPENEEYKTNLVQEMQKKGFWEGMNYIKTELEISDDELKSTIADVISESQELNCPFDQLWEDNNYEDLVKMDVNLFMTTNYDLLFPRALNGKCQCVNFLKGSKPLSDYLKNTNDEKDIIYLHGSVDDMKSIVISGDDVIKMYESESWTVGLSAVLATSKILFLGVSFDDIYLSKYLKKISEITNNPCYSISLEMINKEKFPGKQIVIGGDNPVVKIREVLGNIKKTIKEIILLRLELLNKDGLDKIKSLISNRFVVFRTVNFSNENNYTILDFGNCRNGENLCDVCEKIKEIIAQLKQEKYITSNKFVCYISQNRENYGLTTGSLRGSFKTNQIRFLTELIDKQSMGFVIDKVNLDLCNEADKLWIQLFSDKKGNIFENGKEYSVYAEEKIKINNSENSGTEVHVAGLVFYKGKLLLEKRKASEALVPDKYSLPGGRLKKGEGFKEGLKRILKQKYGVEVEHFLILDEFKAYDANIPGIAFLTSTETLVMNTAYRLFDRTAICEMDKEELGCERELLDKAFFLYRMKPKETIKLRIIMLTDCIYHCKCCHHENIKDISIKSDINQIIRSLYILNQSFDVIQITITGGEPLLPRNRENLMMLLEVIRSDFGNIDLSIITNAYYLDTECITLLKKYDVRYKISVYGYNNVSFLQYTGFNQINLEEFDYIQDLENKLVILGEEGCKVTINIPLHQYIYPGIDKLFNDRRFKEIVKKNSIKIKIIDMVKPRTNSDVYQDAYVSVNEIISSETEQQEEFCIKKIEYEGLPISLYKYPCQNCNNCETCFNNFALTLKPDGKFLICRRALDYHKKNREIFEKFKIEIEDVDLGEEYGMKDSSVV